MKELLLELDHRCFLIETLVIDILKRQISDELSSCPIRKDRFLGHPVPLIPVGRFLSLYPQSPIYVLWVRDARLGERERMVGMKCWVRLCTSLLLAAPLVLSATLLQGQRRDGVLDTGEYDTTLRMAEGRYTLAWTIEGDRIHFAMAAHTEGWVAVGLDPIVVADNADLIFGWVDDQGRPFVVDAHSQGAYGPYPPDTRIGGSDDILDYAGSEREGVTTLEFTRLLDTGDSHDSVIQPRGGNKIIWMYGEVDDYNTRYTEMGYAWLRPEGGEPAGRSLRTLLRFILMAMSIILLYFGFFVPVSRKGGEEKGMVYQYLGLAGVALGLGGAVLTAVRAAGETVFIPRAMQLGFSLASAASLLILGATMVSLTLYRVERESMQRAAIRWSLGLSFFFLVLTYAMDLVSHVLS